MAIKFKFNPNRDYQMEAVKAVVDVFQGLEHEEDIFTVSYDTLGTSVSDKGYANKRPFVAMVRKNIESVQIRNNLMVSEFDGLNISVEMETGTGKTYVYLDTIVQLYKKYNFRKFIILVPSVAIREGVYSSVNMLKEHFEAKHDINNIACNIYSGKTVGQVVDFASSPNLEIFIMNIDSFNKDTNILRRDDLEDYRGVAPIEFLKSTNPFIIIDEPQSVEGKSNKAKEAIEDLNPCFIARYSATHVEKYSMVYKLDPIDAYNKGLVKQISVSSLSVGDNKNIAHIVLKKFNGAGNPIIELNVLNRGKAVKKECECKNNARLIDVANNDLYEGLILTNWNVEQGWIEVSGEKYYLFADTDAHKDDFKKAQIKETIYRHLLKDLKLRKKGIKVLSLFFIDKVANYRENGKYYQWFEQLLVELLDKKEFESLRELYDVKSCHKGYFAVDKKGVKDTTGKTEADVIAYDLIMKGKEELISLNNRVHFIFSHSALREGWDNPNVFQICTLNETDKDKSKIKMRQELGRGLRLCVDNNGNVISDRELNQLTVVVNESYEDFAEKLQREIVEDLALETFDEKVRILSQYVQSDGDKIGVVRAQNILNCLVAEKFLKVEKKKLKYTQEAVGVIQKDDISFLSIKDEKIANYTNTIFSFMKDQIKVPQKPKDINKECENKVNTELTKTVEFKALREILEQESKFNITLNPNEVISRVMEDYRKENYIVANRYLSTNREISEIEKDGTLKDIVSDTSSVTIDEHVYHFDIDIVRKLTNSTKLSRKTIINLLQEIDKRHPVKEIYINPQHFVEKMSDKIKAVLTDILKSTGLSYEKSSRTIDNVIRLEPQTINYDPDDKRIYKVKNSNCLYDFIQCDSDVEREIAQILDTRQNVKLFFKLENSFKIKTPVGNYSPDWAIIKDDPNKPISFIVESKHSVNKEDLRGVEQLKISAAEKHFLEITGNQDFFKFTNAPGVAELVDR